MPVNETLSQTSDRFAELLRESIDCMQQAADNSACGESYEAAHDMAARLLTKAASMLGLAVTAGGLQPALNTLVGKGPAIDSMIAIIEGTAPAKRSRFLDAIKSQLPNN